jgi:hypothetical protein
MDIHSLHKGALVAPKQAASYLRCSVQWLAVMRMHGRGPSYIKHGGWVRYRVSELDAWTERHRIPAGDAA